MNASSNDPASVRIIRASNHLGADVRASDGQKVGDISDFVFDVSGQPELSHVIITTGGFLTFGGEARAVPASAIRTKNDTVHIDISSDAYYDVPILPEDRTRYFANEQNRERIQNAFSRAGQSASVSATRTGAQAQVGGTQVGVTAQTQDRNRMQAQNQQGQRKYLTYSELRNSQLYGSNDERLGFVVDAWVNLDTNRAPFIEINPTAWNPLMREPYYIRYAIPLSSFRSDGNFNQLTFNVTSDQLNQADPVSDTQAVSMAESGFVGNKVLQVRVEPRRGQYRGTQAAE